MAKVILRPNGVGDATELDVTGETNNWEAVDDVTPDGDSTYVSTDATDNPRDLYELTNPGIPSGAIINDVRVFWRAKGSSFSRPVLGLNSEANTGTLTPLQGSYTTHDEGLDGALDRPGGGTWSASDFASLQAGIDLNDGRCTQVYVEVDYTPEDVEELVAVAIVGTDAKVFSESLGLDIVAAITGTDDVGENVEQLIATALEGTDIQTYLAENRELSVATSFESTDVQRFTEQLTYTIAAALESTDFQYNISETRELVVAVVTERVEELLLAGYQGWTVGQLLRRPATRRSRFLGRHGRRTKERL